MQPDHLGTDKGHSAFGLVRILTAFLLVVSGELFAQKGADQSQAGVEYMAVDVTTPIDQALERGILASHLPEGVPNTVIAIDNPLLLLIKSRPSALLFDNDGDRFTGAYRIGASLNLVNPIGLDDTFSAHAFGTDERFLFRRLAYIVPIGNYGTRIGASYFDFDYRLAKDFEALKANGDGSSSSLHALQPIVQTRAANIILSYAHERKKQVDRVDTQQGRIENRVIASNRLGAIGHLRDGVLGGGLNRLFIAVDSGDLRIDPPAVLAADQSAAGRKTQGGFHKYLYRFQRLQRITENASLSLALFGQTASKNLPGAEKFFLGGATAVRAYPLGEALGDSGFVFKGEFRYVVPGSDVFGAKLALTGFYDMGRIKINENPLPTDAINRRSIAGYGIGVHVGNASEFVVRASMAWRAENEAPQFDTAKRIPRVWFQAIKWF